MKQLNGLGGFVAAAFLLLMASSMISATIAEIRPAAMASKDITLDSSAGTERTYESIGADLVGQDPVNLCEALAIETGDATDGEKQSDRCMMEAVRASIAKARWAKPAVVRAGIAIASSC